MKQLYSVRYEEVKGLLRFAKMTGKLPDPENHAAKGFGPPHSWALRNRRSASGEKHGNHGLFGSSRKNFRPATLTLCAASCTMNWVRALSSAVRAFGLHPKGRPFKSDSAHHCDATPFSA